MPWRTAVGVVADVRQTYDDRDANDVYVPYFQDAPGRYASFYLRAPSGGSLASLDRVVRMLEHQLYGVRPVDAATLTGACLVMTVTGLAVMWWSASRWTTRNTVAVLNES